MARTETDYGLPPLTFDEAARILGVQKGRFMEWIMETLSPSPTQWSLWKNGDRTLPEAVIRLFLMQRGAIESAYQRELRELKEAVEKIATEERGIKRKTRGMQRKAG